ncbi:MAG: tetratricopeptide repeat protein [Candidatus Paceibacterota bacterium]
MIDNKSSLTLVKILRWGVYLIALTPLIIFSQYISPFHFGKVIVFRSLVEVAAVFYLLLIWRDRSYLPKTNAVFWAFLAFAGAFTLTTATSSQMYESFWGTLERMGGLWTFWHYFVYFVILTSVTRTEKDWFNLFRVVILVGVLSAFYGFLQKTEWEWIVGSGNRARIFGTIGNAALFAGYQIVTMFLALTLFFRRQNISWEKYFFAGAAAINFVAIMMTAVRGSVLGVGVGLLVFSFLYAWKLNSAKAKRVLISLVLFAIMFVIFANVAKDSSFVRSSGYLTRLTDFSLTSPTVETRFWAWQAGIDGWNDSAKTILLGWGPENFNIPFSVHFNPKFYSGPGAETLFDRAHNMFVEVLVTMGIIGFLAYLGIFAVAFRALNVKFPMTNDKSNPNNKIQTTNIQNSNNQILRIGLISLLVAYMIHNAFIFDTSANLIVFFTALGFISWLSPHNTNSQIETNATNSYHESPITNKTDVKRLNKALVNSVGTILFITAAILIYRTNIIPTKANYASTRGIVAGWQNDFNRASAKFREAINYNTFGKYEVRHRYAQYLFEYSAGKQMTPEIKKEIEFTVEKVKETAESRPMDYLPRLYASRLLILLGKEDRQSPYNDEALKYSLEALEIAPTFVRTYFEVAQAYLNKGDSAGAIEYFKKASELNPNTQISLWYWGIAEIQAGNTQRGLEIVDTALEKGYSMDEQDLVRIINIYVGLNDLQKIAEMYERLILVAPKNPQYYASLATAYANLGRIDDAVATARKAVQVDPSFEPDARAFVQSLGREL